MIIAEEDYTCMLLGSITKIMQKKGNGPKRTPFYDVRNGPDVIC